MVGEAPILGLSLLVEDKINEIESGEESWRQLNVLNHTEFRVVLRVDRVGSGEDGRASIECANDASFSYRDSLLLHGFVKDCTRVVVHLVELIDTADTAIRKDQRTTL